MTVEHGGPKSEPRPSVMLSCRLHTSPQFYISGNCIDVVDSWPHLGHIICKNSDDNLDILNRRSSFIAQANDVICTFGKLDCV